MEKEFYVLYGSQTGNAEFIAKELHTKLLDMGLSATCSTCNVAKKANLKDLAHAVVIVCSTTGNGDSPENADAFWRSIKARALPKNHFEGLPFAVLGLGDTNYDKFCHMGKNIDKRMGELGGIRLVDLHCADEPTNLEEVVEAWKVSVSAAIKNLAAALSGAPAPDQNNSESVGSAVMDAAAAAMDKLDVNETQVSVSILPEGVKSALAVWAQLGLEGNVAEAPAAKLLPGGAATSSPDPVEIVMGNTAGSAAGGNAFEGAASKANSKTDNAAEMRGWGVDNPFSAPIKSARYLTQHSAASDGNIAAWGEDKAVIETLISLAGSGITYEPGDSVAICCPNPQPLVDLVLARLNEGQRSTAAPAISLDTMVRMKNADVLSVGEILSYKLDLVGNPRKAGVMRLSTLCRDPQEAALLQHICSKGDTGKQLWRHFVEAQGLGVAELLALFPSCCPTLDQLLCACSALPPRCYSIASSPLRDPQSVRIAFSVVRYKCSTGLDATSGAENTEILRKGICTTYLENILQPWLQPSMSPAIAAGSVCVRLFHKPTINFKLPGSTSFPLILIGPGTGVAPFVGFLEQREALERERQCLGRQQHEPASGEGATITAATKHRSTSNSNISTGAKECCRGEWRGGIELEDLPIEGSSVDMYLNSVAPGDIWLFFGCRNTKDFLFQDELQEFVHETLTLDNLEIAFSRLGPEKVYVQHKMLARGAELAALILNQCAYVYICGDGNKMAKDVEAAIVEILVSHGSVHGVNSEAEAKAILTDMRQRRRFVLDIWS